MDRVWKPNVTVAAVIEQDGRFLLVEEETVDGLRFNQPAGHLEAGESLVQAAAREALEETAHRFRPESLVGVYQWPRPDGAVTYLRFAFAGPGRDGGSTGAGPALLQLWLPHADAGDLWPDATGAGAHGPADDP